MKREKRTVCAPLALWLVTFSDLVTLLLTFFVLLLTMSSMDQSFITRVTVMPLDLGVMDSKGAGRISIALQEVLELIDEPWEVLDKVERIKDLLYPDENLPNDVSRSTLNENLKVLARDDGVALVLTDKLLFPRGGYELDDTAREILDQVTPLLGYANEPVFISAHTDDAEAPREQLFELSAKRVESVLAYFIESGLRNEQFSIAAYGDTKPMYPNDSGEHRAANRRIEILIRTNRAIGSYS
ncbi:OmpA/MotB family protein [Paucidesulfovibrio longus]|uniref:OmpA/MotB family protein n=1 Tax=Paucidesulfovibrio longus TaxID=889 RepID=UPI0003B407E7|nr:OmpA family protein [Paucidesulfovibrio longus]